MERSIARTDLCRFTRFHQSCGQIRAVRVSHRLRSVPYARRNNRSQGNHRPDWRSRVIRLTAIDWAPAARVPVYINGVAELCACQVAKRKLRITYSRCADLYGGGH